MSAIGIVAEDVKRLSKTFRPLLDLGVLLEGVRDIDKEVERLNDRLSNAQTDLATAEAATTASKARLAATLEAEKAQQGKSAEAMALAEDKAAEVERLATEDGQAIRDQAKMDADQVTAAARREEQKVRATILAQQDILDTLVRQTVEQQAVLVAVNEKIAEMKQMVAGVAS